MDKRKEGTKENGTKDWGHGDMDTKGEAWGVATLLAHVKFPEFLVLALQMLRVFFS